MLREPRGLRYDPGACSCYKLPLWSACSRYGKYPAKSSALGAGPLPWPWRSWDRRGPLRGGGGGEAARPSDCPRTALPCLSVPRTQLHCALKAGIAAERTATIQQPFHAEPQDREPFRNLRHSGESRLDLALDVAARSLQRAACSAELATSSVPMPVQCVRLVGNCQNQASNL